MCTAHDDPRATSVIRPPVLARIWVAVFSIVWCAVIVTEGVRLATHGSPSALLLLLLLAFGLTIGVRVFRMCVIVGADALIVRNFFRSRSLARADIEGFRIGPMSNQPFSRTIYVLLRDGNVFPLEVAGRPLGFKRAKRSLADRQAMLSAWLERAG